jgi:hypothetical protein
MFFAKGNRRSALPKAGRATRPEFRCSLPGAGGRVRFRKRAVDLSNPLGFQQHVQALWVSVALKDLVF